MSHQVPASGLLGGHDARGLGHDVRVRVGHAVPAADHMPVAVRDERGWLRVAVPGPGVAHVAEVQWAGARGGGHGKVAGRHTHGCRRCRP